MLVSRSFGVLGADDGLHFGSRGLGLYGLRGMRFGGFMIT